MPTASVTHTFVNGQPNDGSEVNTNFSDLVTFINTNAIQKDASVAFTGVPSGPATDPSSDNQLARKAYVDGRSRGVLGSTNRTSNLTLSSSASYADTGLSVAFTMPTLASPRAVTLSLFFPEIKHATSISGGSMDLSFVDVQFRLTNGTTVIGGARLLSGFTNGLAGVFTRTYYDNNLMIAGAQTIKLYAKFFASNTATAVCSSDNVGQLQAIAH